MGHEHQAAQSHPLQGADLPGQLGNIPCRHPFASAPRFRRYLNTQLQRPGMIRTLGGEACRDLGVGDRLGPVKVRGDGAGLVRLDAADEMPGEAIVQLRDLGHGFLQVVFAKIRQPCKPRGLQRFG